MSNDKGVPSRLAQRASGGGPVRGIGSGFSENQRIVGARDPETAARIAATDPEEMSRILEEQEKAAEEIERMREELVAALDAGNWESPQPLPPGSTWEKLLARQDAKLIKDWHGQYKKFIDAASEKEDEDVVRDTVNSFSVQPDDPLYDPMVDKSRRSRIEASLKPLDFESMVFQGFVEQDIPIQKSLTVTMRTLTTQQGLWIEYYIAKQPDMSTQNLRHTFSLLQVSIALDKVNGRPMSPSVDKLVRQDQREEFLKALEQRMERLCQMPSILTDDFIIQYIWFTGRVRKLLAGNLSERVGNS